MSLEIKYKKNLESLSEDATFEDLINTFDTVIEKIYALDEQIKKNIRALSFCKAIGRPELIETNYETIEELWEMKREIYENYKITNK